MRARVWVLGVCGFAALAAAACGGGGGGFAGSDAAVDGSGLEDAVALPDGSVVQQCSHWVRRVYTPGSDGVLGTSDDGLMPEAYVQTVALDNTVTSDDTASSPGPDGKWGTNDDVFTAQERVIQVTPSTIHIVRFKAPGPDGTWRTDDDVIDSYRSGTTQNGRLADVYTFSGPGADGTWRTTDDVRAQRWIYTYGNDQSAPHLREDNFTGPGADGQWATSDDQLAIVTSRWKEWGLFSTATGPDGLWGTKDDPASSRYTDVRNTGGFVQLLETWKAGPDGMLFTPDDQVSSTATVTCKDGIFDARIRSSPGADGVWATADDIVGSRLRIEGCPGSCDGPMPRSPLDPK